MTRSARHPRLMSAVLLLLTLSAGFLGGVAWHGSRQPAVTQEDGQDGQDREGGEDRSRRRLVLDEIGLDPEVRSQADEIIRHFRAEMRVLDEEFQEAYRPRQRALVTAVRDSIKTLLTAEQAMVYDSLLSVRYDRRGRGRGGR